MPNGSQNPSSNEELIVASNPAQGGAMLRDETISFASTTSAAAMSESRSKRLTFSGITFVIAAPNAAQETAGYLPASMTRGVVMGLLASLCNAFGATFSRMGTLGCDVFAASGCDPLEATVIRVCIASSFSILAALVTRATH